MKHKWVYNADRDRWVCERCFAATYDPDAREDLCEAHGLQETRKPYRNLQNVGVLTVDDLITKLHNLPREVRIMPVLMPSSKDWSYISSVRYDPVDGCLWPTLVESEVGWSPLDL